MNYACGGAEINQTMESLPALSQAADAGGGGGQRQWQHERPGEKSDCNERSLADVGNDLREVEELVEPEIGEQMQAAVEEGKQPQQTTEADEPIPSRDAPRRSYRERDQEKS